jgi:hypothetical protein
MDTSLLTLAPTPSGITLKSAMTHDFPAPPHGPETALETLREQPPNFLNKFRNVVSVTRPLEGPWLSPDESE